MNVIQKGLFGVRHLVGTQLLSRVFTFILNVLTTRLLAPEVIGIANIQLQLLLNIISLLTRECFRRALFRFRLVDEQNKIIPSFVTTSWLVLPFGMLVSPIITFLFLHYSNEANRTQQQFETTVILTGISLFIELLSEPFYIFSQISLLYHVRMYVETSAVFLRCIVTYFLVRNDYELLSFGIANIVYSLVLLLGYFGYYFITPSSNTKDLFPRFDRKYVIIISLLFLLFHSYIYYGNI